MFLILLLQQLLPLLTASVAYAIFAVLIVAAAVY